MRQELGEVMEVHRTWGQAEEAAGMAESKMGSAQQAESKTAVEVGEQKVGRMKSEEQMQRFRSWQLALRLPVPLRRFHLLQLLRWGRCTSGS